MFHANVCVYLLSFHFLVSQIKTENPLSQYIRHYETLSYDTNTVHKAQLRAKRSLLNENSLHIVFQAHDHNFHLRLKRDLDVYSNTLEVYGAEEKIKVDTSHIYSGNLLGETESLVFGSVIDGIFEGKIISPKESYFVEKAHRYFPDNKHPNKTFHSVIYREDHVEDPYQDIRQGHSPGCGINDETIQWMERIQKSSVDTKLSLSASPQLFLKPFESVNEKREENGKYLREKREARRVTNKNTCSLYIQIDPFLWRHIREGFPEHTDPRKQSQVTEKARKEILFLIAYQVLALNYIFKSTKFDGKHEHRSINFDIWRIKIHEDHCGSPSYEKNPFCFENNDIKDFLNIHSLTDHGDFCLAYVFTYRNFSGGSLGLGWTADSEGSGGICEKYKTYYTQTSGFTKRSLNTGVITLANYNTRVPPIVSQLTFAHQIAHNFGSPHDYPPECRPGGRMGNFLMFGSATSGDRPNHSRFSSCSIGNISTVLDAIDDYSKRNCFTPSSGSFCGNNIVEPGEECDCGYNDDDCHEKCCYPRLVTMFDQSKNASAKGCTRRALTQCSPSQGPCCSAETCSFLSANEVCKMESECSHASNCNGVSAECTDFLPKPNKFRCNHGTQLCISGHCEGSVCLAWDLKSCFITSQSQGNSTVDGRKLCELACQNGTDICRSTSEFGHEVGLPSGGISLRPGSPCDNFLGFCDESLKCQPIDTDKTRK